MKTSLKLIRQFIAQSLLDGDVDYPRFVEDIDAHISLLEAELLMEKPIVELLASQINASENVKAYWRGYLQGLNRTLIGSVPTQVEEILGEKK